MRRSVLIGLVFSCTLLVASCSVATMAYNNAPHIALYALDDYFDLTPEQEAWLKPRLDRFIAWHRANELPAYRRLVNEASRQIDSGARAQDARALYDSGRARLARAADQGLPDIAAFLAQLTPRQIARLESKLAEDNRKMEEEWRMQPILRQQKRVEKSIERVEDWFGSLSPTQIEKIRATMMALPPLEAQRLADRKRRQAEFIALLKSSPPPDAMQPALRRMLLQPEAGRDAAFQAELDRQLEATVNLVMSLLAEGSPEQRARVQKRLKGYAADIDSLTRS